MASLALLWILGVELAQAAVTPALPADVEAFVARRESCEHFRGEDPYDAERAAYLEHAIDESCRGTDSALAELKVKYKDSAEVQRILAGYEARIER